MTPTQKRRMKSAMWMVPSALANKGSRSLGKQWAMQAQAADRRVEKRKGRSALSPNQNGG